MSTSKASIRDCSPAHAEYKAYVIMQENINPYLLINDRTGAKGIDLYTGESFFHHRIATKQTDIVAHLYTAISGCLTVQEVKDMLFSLLRVEEREGQIL